MFETVEYGNRKHLVKRRDNLLHNHWITSCGLIIQSSDKEDHFLNSPNSIESICIECVHANNSTFQGAKHRDTGKIHAVKPRGENYEGKVKTFCGFEFEVAVDHLSTIKKIIQADVNDITCENCLRSNKFQSRINHNTRTAKI